MDASRPSRPLRFEAAVQRPLSVVYRTAGGAWEGHDFSVEVVAARDGLDDCDVVMDFRDLEAALDALLAPIQGRLLADLGLADPLDLARRLAAALAPEVPAPAWLAEVALTDGRGRRLALRP
jgi:6-pyruvoyl-tetrahydropterin synthase